VGLSFPPFLPQKTLKKTVFLSILQERRIGASNASYIVELNLITECSSAEVYDKLSATEGES
jgi:hypothetical protein